MPGRSINMASVPKIRHSPPKTGLLQEESSSPGLCFRIPVSACTLDGFRAWVKSDELPDHLHVAFLGHEIFLDMSKEEIQSHALVKSAICRILMNVTAESNLGMFLLDGVLITNEAARVSNNPDATLVSRESIQSERVRFVPGAGEREQFLEIEGSPDWVMEIVSNSSVRKDTEQLLEAYYRAGISEYWLVDARGEELMFRILHWRKTGYAAAPQRAGWQRSRVFGRAFRLERKRNDLGFWEYTLQMKPA